MIFVWFQERQENLKKDISDQHQKILDENLENTRENLWIS